MVGSRELSASPSTRRRPAVRLDGGSATRWRRRPRARSAQRRRGARGPGGLGPAVTAAAPRSRSGTGGRSGAPDRQQGRTVGGVNGRPWVRPSAHAPPNGDPGGRGATSGTEITARSSSGTSSITTSPATAFSLAVRAASSSAHSASAVGVCRHLDEAGQQLGVGARWGRRRWPGRPPAVTAHRRCRRRWPWTPSGVPGGGRCRSHPPRRRRSAAPVGERLGRVGQRRPRPGRP